MATKPIRITLSQKETATLYELVGGAIGQIQAKGEIADMRASEISQHTADLRYLQDRLNKGLQDSKEAERTAVDVNQPVILEERS
jgi:hypothetical protein